MEGATARTALRSPILTLKRARSLRRRMTQPEAMLWVRLRQRLPDQPAFRRQHPIGPYILDFFCAAAGLCVEVDGSGHGEEAQVAHDERRDAWLKAQGIVVYRVLASSVFVNADEVADGARIFALELMAQRQ